jgi:hypothetical protein
MANGKMTGWLFRWHRRQADSYEEVIECVAGLVGGQFRQLAAVVRGL